MKIVWIKVQGRHFAETDNEHSEGIYSVPVWDGDTGSDALYELQQHLDISADEAEFGWGRRLIVIPEPEEDLRFEIKRHTYSSEDV